MLVKYIYIKRSIFSIFVLLILILNWKDLKEISGFEPKVLPDSIFLVTKHIVTLDSIMISNGIKNYTIEKNKLFLDNEYLGDIYSLNNKESIIKIKNGTTIKKELVSSIVFLFKAGLEKFTCNYRKGSNTSSLKVLNFDGQKVNYFLVRGKDGERRYTFFTKDKLNFGVYTRYEKGQKILELGLYKGVLYYENFWDLVEK